MKDLQLNIEIPEMTKNGKHFLHIADFSIDQVRVGPKCSSLVYHEITVATLGQQFILKQGH